VEIIGMRGISTSSLHLLLIIVASIAFSISFFTESLVLLHNFGVLESILVSQLSTSICVVAFQQATMN